jgi:hypothetical protein
MRNMGIALIALLALAVVISAFGCNGEETTATATPTSMPAPTSAQLSAGELSDTYPLPEGLADGAFDVHVDGTLWRMVEDLSDFGPNDHVYVVVEDSAGQRSIRFGDGEHGSRLPSRSSKVVVTYRLGAVANGNGAP